LFEEREEVIIIITQKKLLLITGHTYGHFTTVTNEI